AFVIRSGKTLIKRWVKGDVPFFPLFINDGPYLQCAGICGILLFLQAIFQRKANPYRPVPAYRRHKSRADMRTYIIRPAIATNGIEEIKTGFKPGYPSVGYL